MTARFFKEGAFVKEEEQAIPEGVVYEDILSAFYNVRLGNYGPLDAGRHFEIRTIPSEGESLIKIDISPDDEALAWHRYREADIGKKLIAATVRLPKKLFESKKGEVTALFNEAVIPVQGVVKDYIGFGDMKCTLIEAEAPPLPGGATDVSKIVP